MQYNNAIYQATPGLMQFINPHLSISARQRNAMLCNTSSPSVFSPETDSGSESLKLSVNPSTASTTCTHINKNKYTVYTEV